MDRSTSRFLGSGLFRAIAVMVFLVMVAAVLAANPAGGSFREPVIVRLAAPAEASDWLRTAAEDFNRSGAKVGSRTVTVSVQSFTGGRKAVEDVRRSLEGEQPYTALITRGVPDAASADLFLATGDYAPAPVASSYVVGVVRGEYARALAGQLGRDTLSVADLWALFDPSTPAGSPVLQVDGGKPRWGAAGADDGHDGSAAIYALSMSFHQSSTPAFSDRALEDWLSGFYAAAQQARPGFQLIGEDMAKFGPTGPSAAVLPEVIALHTADALRQKGQELRIIYPEYALQEAFLLQIVGGKLTEEERQGALKFRRFLLSEEQQAGAESYGLRRVDGSVRTGADSIWQRLSATGAQAGYRPKQAANPGAAEWGQAEQLAERLLGK